MQVFIKYLFKYGLGLLDWIWLMAQFQELALVNDTDFLKVILLIALIPFYFFAF